MPTYSYACTECDNRFDAVQAFTDDALTECPKCSGRLRKLFGSVGVVFKGSGFYRTDSRAGSNGKSTSEKKASSSESSSDIVRKSRRVEVRRTSDSQSSDSKSIEERSRRATSSPRPPPPPSPADRYPQGIVSRPAECSPARLA